MQSGHLYNLEILVWFGNLVDDVAAGAIVRAYHENENLTTIFDIDWNQVRDPALKTMMKEYRARNIRLGALKMEHKEVRRNIVFCMVHSLLIWDWQVGKPQSLFLS
ncbi:unnamed protein product [Calypogeia fissa]